MFATLLKNDVFLKWSVANIRVVISTGVLLSADRGCGG